MKQTTLAFVLALMCAGCGFVDRPRVCDAYMRIEWPESKAFLFAFAPIHGVLLLGCAAADQGCRTVESAVPAGRDAWDWLVMPVRRESVLVRGAGTLGKALTAPAVFAGSYLARWLWPFRVEDRFLPPPGQPPPSQPPADETD